MKMFWDKEKYATEAIKKVKNQLFKQNQVKRKESFCFKIQKCLFQNLYGLFALSTVLDNKADTHK